MTGSKRGHKRQHVSILLHVMKSFHGLKEAAGPTQASTLGRQVRRTWTPRTIESINNRTKGRFVRDLHRGEQMVQRRLRVVAVPREYHRKQMEALLAFEIHPCHCAEYYTQNYRAAVRTACVGKSSAI